MSEKNEPVCFVPDPNGDVVLKITADGAMRYRALKPGWTAEAVERVKRLNWHRWMAKDGGGSPSDAEIIAALFPDPEPEPEPWMREAAREWKRKIADGKPGTRFDEGYAETLALHIAKHAGRAK